MWLESNLAPGRLTAVLRHADERAIQIASALVDSGGNQSAFKGNMDGVDAQAAFISRTVQLERHESSTEISDFTPFVCSDIATGQVRIIDGGVR
jgi:hypothetical protein